MVAVEEEAVVGVEGAAVVVEVAAVDSGPPWIRPYCSTAGGLG